jgi:hypothetical protein
VLLGFIIAALPQAPRAIKLARNRRAPQDFAIREGAFQILPIRKAFVARSVARSGSAASSVSTVLIVLRKHL